jgi:hypothetical protein
MARIMSGHSDACRYLITASCVVMEVVLEAVVGSRETFGTFGVVGCG